MSNQITDLIANADIEGAMELLKSDPKFQTDRQFQMQVIMISSRLASNQKQEMMGLLPFETAMRQKNIISNSILSLAERYEIGGASTSDTPTIIPPPIESKDQNEDALNILFVASDPRGMGKLQLEKEYTKILMQFGRDAPNFKTTIKFEPRADNLTKTLLEEQPAYVHFAGHGAEATEGFNPAGIVLEDRYGNPQIVTGVALANMFRLLKKRFTIKVVLLNACNSMDQAKAISGNGIYSIGMAEEIPDNMAISFASGFYLGLAQTPDDIPYAFEMAINSLMMEGIDGQLVPKLYMDGEEVGV